MWMMGYNEPHEDHHLNTGMVDSYTNNNGTRKLRPLAPRPPSPTCANRFHSAAPQDHHLLHLNHPHPHHHHHLVEQNKHSGSREYMNNSQQMVVVSSRWNPTPEQLQTLEELYRRGTRTPSADEIQHITAQLRRFGKIEGKNVFYWFQNHKARERQKRRRQLDNNNNKQQQQQSSTITNNHDHILRQPPATTFFPSDPIDQLPAIQQKNNLLDVEETRNWAIPTFSEKNVVRERTGKSESMMTSIVDTAGNHQTWIPVEEEEDQRNDDQNELLLHRRRRSFPATWNNTIQSSSSSSFPTNNNHITTTTLFNSTMSCCIIPFPSTSKTTSSSLVVSSSHANRHDDDDDDDDDVDESHETLELFPVNREQPEKYCFSIPRSDHDVSISLSPRRRQFIEFLPLKY